MVDIPPDTEVVLEAQLPSGTTDWPGPPAWTTSTPDTSVLSIVDGSNQMQVTATASADLTVTLDADTLSGTVDLAVVIGAAAPSTPIPLVLA